MGYNDALAGAGQLSRLDEVYEVYEVVTTKAS